MKKFLNHISDQLTTFIGSWYFITFFFFNLVSWIILQSFWPVDPYPYILLNLVLSTLAAVQGSVIMMSQRRQEMKDRQRMIEIHRLVKNCEEYIQKVDGNKKL